MHMIERVKITSGEREEEEKVKTRVLSRDMQEVVIEGAAEVDRK